uniref:Integrase catalytic domain-containing protein n=1 Tax=Meloidogyne incognita TaxID=6306 RepID=A0A914MDV1_MELIC
MDLRAKMTGTERTHDNDVYDEFTKTCPYPSLIGKLKKYVRSLTAQKNELTAILPGNNSSTPPPTATTASTSLAHLPRMALPQFAGNCVEFPSFWSSFQAAVGDLPNISDSVKLSYLKSCLRSAPLAVIESFPLVDQSYPQAVDLLKQKYENPTEISRSLCQSLKQLPTVRKGEYFCRDLSSLVNEFESLICRFTQQGENTDNIHIQLEIESKLPTFVLEEIYRAKETTPAWTTELLKQKLKAILKRKEDISAMNHSSPQKSQVQPPFQKIYSPRNDSPPGPRSSLTFNTQTARRSNAVEPKLPCLFCNVFGHFSPSCQQFPDLYSRRNKLKELRRCFSCMKEGHTTPQCRMPMKCSSCGGPHPRALCANLLPSNPPFTSRPPQRPPQTYRNLGNEHPRQSHYPTRMPNFSPPKPPPDCHFSQSAPYTRITDPRPPPPTNLEPSQQTNSSTNPTSNYRPILLKCVRTTIFNPDFPSCQYEGIVLLDDASTNTYIHTTVANALNLNLSPSSINLGVFNNPSITALPTYTTTFGLKLVDGRSLIIKANTLNHLTQPTPYVPFSNELVYEKDLVRNYQNIVPSILLGSDFYYEIEPTPIYRLPSGYHLIQTLLGLIIAGKPFGCSNSVQITNFSSQTTVTEPPNEFFSLESIGITDPSPTKTDDSVLQEFNQTTEFSNGRYQVMFPFKSCPKTLPLPSNFGLCWGRLRSTLNSLNKNNDLLEKYNKIIEEQHQLEIIETVESPNNFHPPLHYLPHHAVINPKKVRIVYDGSAKLPNSFSLNDCLHPGPVILPELVGVLLRMRIPKIVIVCDIQKAFLQVSVHPNHRDSIRFLWLKNIQEPLSLENLQIYRFTRVPFGLSPSPFLLAATILYHLRLNPSPLTEEILPNIYVDNILFGAEIVREAKEKCDSLINLFSNANMKLREFISNIPETIDHIPLDDKLNGHKQKFLGVGWQIDTDSLFVETHTPPTELSKRTILSFIASHYDPCGYISPSILPLKLFLHELWSERLAWDEVLPEKLINSWNNLINDWQIGTVQIPRLISTLPVDNRIYQLHCFSDASLTAMGCAVYLRTFNPISKISQVSLLFSKTKIKPLKSNNKLTVPRLELIAAKIGTNALVYVYKELSHLNITVPLFLWIDSSAVLGWLTGKNPTNEIFVSNCLNHIRKIPDLMVQHVSGLDNPADICSRGLINAQQLQQQKVWWNGPLWLTTESWPQTDIRPFLSNDPPKVPSPNIAMTFHTQTELNTRTIDPSLFSRLPKLLRIFAFSLRFIYKLRPKATIFPQQFNIDYNKTFPAYFEIYLAKTLLIKQEQKILPPPDKDNESLGLFLDNDGILRAKGRLSYSNLPDDTIEPIYLPSHSPLTKLIVYEYHLLNHHSSPLLTLSMIRRKYWLPKGRKIVSQVIYKSCLPCRRFVAKPFDPPPFPPLPSERVGLLRPFLSVGLDYCGPLRIFDPNQTGRKRKPLTKKYWIVLWVCLSSRALSLDLVPDLTNQSFLLAFRRFVAKCGLPKKVFSDNAPTFTSFQKAVEPQFGIKNIEWDFRAPLAAWKSGHYERLVALIKYHLRRSLSIGAIPKLFSLDHITTVLVEIETIINSRPIAYDSSNPADPRPLRPIDFLKPLDHEHSQLLEKPITNSLLPPSSNQRTLTLLWKAIQRNIVRFKTQWTSDYILSLRERNKNQKSPSRFPKEGELVIVYNDVSPISLWPLATILEIYKNTSDFPSTAKIKMLSGHITTRSVKHLIPLETFGEKETNIPPIIETNKIPNPLNNQPVDNTPYLQLRSRKVPRH